MTVCEWCGETFDRTTNRGPIPKYCSAAHRQAAHRARQSESIGDMNLEPLVHLDHFGYPYDDPLAVRLAHAHNGLVDVINGLAKIIVVMDQRLAIVEEWLGMTEDDES